MKKIFLFIFLLCSLTLSAQVVSSTVSYSQPAAGSGGATYTDDFEGYSEAALAGQGDWITWMGVITVVTFSESEYVYPNSAGALCGVAYDDTFDDDQYAENGGYFDVLSGYYIGPGVRLTGSAGSADGYGYAGGSTDSYLFRIDDGSYTVLSDAGDAVTDDDVLRIEIEGTTIRCYKNGDLDTSLGSNGTFTDATYSSGKAGIVGLGTGGNYIPDWEGGDL